MRLKAPFHGKILSVSNMLKSTVQAVHPRDHYEEMWLKTISLGVILLLGQIPRRCNLLGRPDCFS